MKCDKRQEAGGGDGGNLLSQEREMSSQGALPRGGGI